MKTAVALLMLAFAASATDVDLKDLEVTLEVVEDDGSDLNESIALAPGRPGTERADGSGGADPTVDDGFIDDTGAPASDELEEAGAQETIDDGLDSDDEFSEDIPLGVGDDLDEEEEVELDTFDEEMGSSL